jgi:hypothetical protein
MILHWLCWLLMPHYWYWYYWYWYYAIDRTLLHYCHYCHWHYWLRHYADIAIIDYCWLSLRYAIDLLFHYWLFRWYADTLIIDISMPLILRWLTLPHYWYAIMPLTLITPLADYWLLIFRHIDISHYAIDIDYWYFISFDSRQRHYAITPDILTLRHFID